jgi:hypothetical protein
VVSEITPGRAAFEQRNRQGGIPTDVAESLDRSDLEREVDRDARMAPALLS